VHVFLLLFVIRLASYIVRANEKQAVFTGKQQRDGVAILAFIVAGLFGPLGDEDAYGAFAGEQDAEHALAAAYADAAGYDADSNDEAAKVSKNFVFDWGAYRSVWGDTPVHVAVTSMFAEYAVLYARIARRTTSAVPPPMTKTEGLEIGEQAKRFVNTFVTPILGHIASVKIHKLLCHVAETVKWHGNLQNCNTAANESEHKAEKPHYDRTSKDARTFTRQLVRHAHGTRGILARHAKEDEAATTAWQGELARRAEAATAGSATASPRDARARASSVRRTSSGATLTPTTTEVDRARKQKRRMYNVGKVLVADLARRPDLANVGALLKMAAHRQVRVSTRTPIQARFDCGTRVGQQLRAAEEYLGAPWYDTVLYNPGGDDSKLCIKEIRAIVRGPKGDALVLVTMEDVPAEPLCSFVARGCIRLKWHVAENATEVTLRLVPVRHVRRLAFVVPDFADLAARQGIDADVPSMDSPLQDRLDMRFFLNVFFPWDAK